MTQTLVVGVEDEDTRLDSWLAQSVPGLSRAQASRLIKDSAVLIDNQPARPSARLVTGMLVSYDLPPAKPLDLVAEDLALTFLYEDEHLVIVDKPKGLPVHPDHHHRSRTLVHGLLHALKGRLSSIGGVERPGIVHRLDKGTTGALVVAKTDAAHQALVEKFARHDIERRYWAIVLGRFNTEERLFSDPIERHPRDRKRMTSRTGKGRPAGTAVRCLESFARPYDICSLVECRLETGRTHQVRVHLSDHNLPILGDDTYGPRNGPPKAMRGIAERLDRPMLHAKVLGFLHPITNVAIHIESPLPDDFETVLAQLRRVTTDSASTKDPS